MAVQTISVSSILTVPTAAVTLDEDASILSITGTGFNQPVSIEVRDGDRAAAGIGLHASDFDCAFG